MNDKNNVEEKDLENVSGGGYSNLRFCKAFMKCTNENCKYHNEFLKYDLSYIGKTTTCPNCKTETLVYDHMGLK